MSLSEGPQPSPPPRAEDGAAPAGGNTLSFPRTRGKVGMGAGVHGVAEIGFAVADGRTRLSHLYERNPLRVLFPRPPSGDLSNAVVVTTSGGLVAGDRIEVAVRLEARTAAHLSASAAEKIYRSTGSDTVVEQRLDVRDGAWLEFLPPETILFDAARLRRTTTVELAGGGGFLGGGIIVFGRRARGEGFTTGLLHEAWEVRRGGRLVWGDALHIDGDVAAVMADPACFGGAAVCATLILASPDAALLLEGARDLQGRSPVRAGATLVNGVLVARWLGDDAWALRCAYADLACHLREAALGLPPRLPRLWNV